MKYRKKPVVVEVVQWDSENTTAVLDFASTAKADAAGICIHTLEGTHRASVGDYIIKGVHGEFYPCKPDIFAKTYEPDEPPRPLTLEELRGMDGKPVYIIDGEDADDRYWELSERAEDYIDGRNIDNYGTTWLAYPTEPREEP